MTDYFFYNPRQPHVFNEYDNPAYTFNQPVDSFLYKLWQHAPSESDGMASFSVPDYQYGIQLNEFGKVAFIEIHKDDRVQRKWIGKKKYGLPGKEQPISHYKAFYSGGIDFEYDQNGKLLRYVDSNLFQLIGRKPHVKEFSYDDTGNQYCKFGETEYWFNDLGQLTTITVGNEADYYYSRLVYSYDEKGRITTKDEYGYSFGEDENAEVEYYLEKGIQHYFCVNYTYRQIDQSTTECISRVTIVWDLPTDYISQIIVFDNYGLKKYQEHYNDDGTLHERSDYTFTFDERENWIRAMVKYNFPAYNQTKKYPILEREIHYTNDSEAKLAADNMYNSKPLLQRIKTFLRF